MCKQIAVKNKQTAEVFWAGNLLYFLNYSQNEHELKMRWKKI